MVIGTKRFSNAVSIEFDPKARVAYIRFKTGKISKTIENSEHFLLDIRFIHPEYVPHVFAA